MAVSALERSPVRTFPSYQSIPPEQACFPMVALIPALYTFVGNSVWLPGLEDEQDSLRQSLKLVTLPEAVPGKRVTGYVGSLFHELISRMAYLTGLSAPGMDPTPEEAAARMYPAERFGELVALTRSWHEENPENITSALLGACDAPNLSHATHTRFAYEGSNHVLVGIDPLWFLKRKESPGDERPRFPFPYWRLYELARLPTVHAVFEIPIEPQDASKPHAFFEWMYDQLNIKVLTTEEKHPLYPEYAESMHRRGGRVIATGTIRSPFAVRTGIHSTANYRRLAKRYYDGRYDVMLMHMRSLIAPREKEIERLYRRVVRN